MTTEKSGEPTEITFAQAIALIEASGAMCAAKAIEQLKAFEKTGCSVVLFEGDAADGNFNIGRAVVLVKGNLKVNDILADSYQADTSLLIVLGDVSCKNLLNLSAMHITGNLTVGNVLVGDSLYDYALRVGGDLTVPTILEYGHVIDVAGKIEARDIYSLHSVKDHSGTRKSNLDASAMVDSLVKLRDNERIPDLSQTLQYIRSGRTVFRKPN